MATSEGKRFSFRRTYRAYLVAAFGMVAAITGIIIIGVVAFVFNVYFTSYTSNNMEAVSEFTASRIADEYNYTRSLDSINYESLMQNLQINDEAGIMVLDARGNSVFDTSVHDGRIGGKGEGPSAASQVAIADIVNNNKVIGSVRIWIYGSDVLMNKLDYAFRNDTYQALVVAGLAAVLIATLIGLWFSQTLIKPIRKITNAASRISEGDLSARTGMKGRDEIGQLGATFDEMADSIEKDKEMEVRLTSDVAHELRTPLMAIQATVEAMLDGVYKADSEHLAMVDSEVRRLSRLVDALLKLTRLERRSQPLNEEINDMGEIVETIVASHEVFVEDSGLKIEAHVDGVVKSVCDKDMIRQAVANLVSNAVRYTPEGGRIDVYVHRDAEWAVIDVQDTGIGLTPEEEKMVFSRFWRADSDRGRSSGGLGIGLSVVKEIVSRHKGLIKVKGEKGVGSTFTIMLPAYDEEASRKQARAAIKRLESRVKAAENSRNDQ